MIFPSRTTPSARRRDVRRILSRCCRSRGASRRRWRGCGITCGSRSASRRTSRRETACSAGIIPRSWRLGWRTDAFPLVTSRRRCASSNTRGWRTSPRTGSSSSSSGVIFSSFSPPSTATTSSSRTAPRVAATRGRAGRDSGAMIPPRSPRGKRARPGSPWWTRTCANSPPPGSCPTAGARTSPAGSRSTPAWTGASGRSTSRTRSWTTIAAPTGETGSRRQA